MSTKGPREGRVTNLATRRGPRTGAVLLLLATALGCSEQRDRGLLVSVNVAPALSAQVRQVEVQVLRGQPGSESQVADGTPASLAWKGYPLRIALVPRESDPAPSILVALRALDESGAMRSVAAVRTGFPEQGWRRLDVTLQSGCEMGCPEDGIRDCRGGTCADPREVPPQSLPPVEGAAEPDGGTPPPTDGGGGGGGDIEVMPRAFACSSRADCSCVSEMALGEQHTCALAGDGTTWCWGSDEESQRGRGPDSVNNAPDFPTKVQTESDGPAGFRFIASGATHACGATPLGRVLCWGEPQHGRLGYVLDSSITSTPYPERAGNLMNIHQLVAGMAHTCGLDGSGTAWCWGLGNDGQLGRGTVTGIDGDPMPSAIPLGAKFARLAAGSVHTCGLVQDGRLFCWGNNSEGKLGIGRRTTVEADPQRVGERADARFVDVTAGHEHTCAVEAGSGKVCCWGNGYQGQLGSGMALNSDVPVCFELSAGERAVGVVAGAWHSCAWSASGKLFCWGLNREGQVDGSPDTGTDECDSPRDDLKGSCYLSPTEVTELGGRPLPRVQRVYSGPHARHTCATFQDGSLACWGNDDKGQVSAGQPGVDDVLWADSLCDIIPSN